MAVSIDVIAWCKRWGTIDSGLQKEFLSLQFCHSQAATPLITPILVAVLRGKTQPNVCARDIKQVASSLWSRSRVASPTVVTRTLFVDETIKAYVAVEGKDNARVCQAMVRTAATIFDVLCPRKPRAGGAALEASRMQLQNTLKRVTFGETAQQAAQLKTGEDDLTLEEVGVLGETGPAANARNYGAAFCTLVECFHTVMHSPYYRMHDLYLGTSAFLGALVHQLHYYLQLYIPEVNQLLLRVATTCAGDDISDAQNTEDLLYLVTHRWFLTVFSDVVMPDHVSVVWHRFVSFGWKFVLQLALQILFEALGSQTPTEAPDRSQNQALENSPGANARKQHLQQQAATTMSAHLFSVPPECVVDVLSELPANVADMDVTIRRSWFWRPRLGTATLLKLEREHISTSHASRVVRQERTD